MTKKTYISRQDAVNSGMTKKNGVFYKKSLLEIGHTKGWLEYKNSKYGADDRLRFGMRLALDCHIANRENLHAGYIFNNKVDISAKVESSALLEVKDRYYKAVHAVPAEFWPIVRQICIDEKEPEAPAELSERQKAYFYYMCRIDLCRGLDRIIDTYNHKLKNI